jgi:integrase
LRFRIKCKKLIGLIVAAAKPVRGARDRLCPTTCDSSRREFARYRIVVRLQELRRPQGAWKADFWLPGTAVLNPDVSMAIAVFANAPQFDFHLNATSYLPVRRPSAAWSVAEIEQFEAKYPIGTKARLALALLLYTGQRRSDVVLFGRQQFVHSDIKQADIMFKMTSLFSRSSKIAIANLFA